MNIEARERSRSVTPRQAVEDAMMVAQLNLLDTQRKAGVSLETISPETNLDWFIHGQTMGKCKEGSLAAANFLTHRYPDLFSGVVLLQADHTVARLRNGWGNHFYFLARDKVGVWYTGSPANYEPSSATSNLTRIISSENLDQVLGWIKRADKGEWASAKFVKDFFDTDDKAMPIKSNPYILKLWKHSMSSGNHPTREIAVPLF